jgi:O-antigen ligase
MMEGTYFYGEYQRWNLGWENPNPAGAFVAILIPWLWGIAYGICTAGRLGSWKVLLPGLLVLSLEVSLWFLLCKTYSRGALVAIIFAGLIFLAFAWMQTNWQRAAFLSLPRFLAVILFLGFTGFFSRIAPDYVTQDASAMNRLTLWKGGLQMVAASPWRGWGVDQSGPGFMHWFQPLESDEGYAGMVNSYLHVGVERGLPFLTAILAGFLGVLFLVGFVLVRERKSPEGQMANLWGRALLLGAGCSLLVFLGANIFSTLWIFEKLWWILAVAMLWILVSGFSEGGPFGSPG